MVPGFAAAAPPVCSDERLVIELVAKEPDIVTPTGLAVDEQGRIWVIENHTHQRPAEYKGPTSDRIRVFSDFDAEGKAKKITTFADGFKNSMAIALGKEGIVFFATRSEIYILRDKDGDGVADEKKLIVKLESKGDYPHNGLSGFAFDGLGNIYFALGENLGASYKVVGSDGSTESGGGEGGSIYRCRPDGSKVKRVATGFWNTFHLTFDAFGRLFAVDNDPDSRGPCRLLHIVPGGDYGYRYRNGRKGLHPFTAWNGELPGTLPMVAGTAEAPSGVLAYESNAFPQDYRGNLLSTSWGDHTIERFTLFPRGASYGAKQQTLVRGGDNFRPVGIVQGLDGAAYITDWVDRSYPVHGKGAIWRLRAKERRKDDGITPSKVAALRRASDLDSLLTDARREIRVAAAEALADSNEGRKLLVSSLATSRSPRARMECLWAVARHASLEPELRKALENDRPEVRAEAARLCGELLHQDHKDETLETALLNLATRDSSAAVRLAALGQIGKPESLKQILPLLADSDPFVAGIALDRLGQKGNTALLRPHAFDKDPKMRVGVLLALRRADEAEGREMVRAFLGDGDPEVRRAAIQWVGEEKLKDFVPLLGASAAKLPVTRELFESYLGALDFLNEKRDWNKETSGEEFVIKILHDAKQPAEIQTIALRMIRPDHPGLPPANLKTFLESDNEPLRTEAARTLALRGDAGAQDLLRKLVENPKAETALRSDAVLGLANSATTDGSRKLLTGLLHNPALRRDALRSLREAAVQPEVEKAIFEAWEKNGAPDAERRELAGQILLAIRASKSADAEKLRPKLTQIADPRPTTEAEWKKLLSQKGDVEAGQRLFFHKNGPRCFTCHRVDGRGGKLGPDLSKIGRSAPREKIIESILTPSKEIAPLFVSWSIITRDGKTHTGLIVEEGSIGGAPSTVKLADADGKITVVKVQDIEERHALNTSIMPDKLPEQMTPREFVDLVEFLMSLK